jgi:hypothetical protein
LINRLDASLGWHDRDFLKLKDVCLPWQGRRRIVSQLRACADITGFLHGWCQTSFFRFFASRIFKGERYIPKPPEDAGFGFVFLARKHRPSIAIGLAITRSRQSFLAKNTLPKSQRLQVAWVYLLKKVRGYCCS